MQQCPANLSRGLLHRFPIARPHRRTRHAQSKLGISLPCDAFVVMPGNNMPNLVGNHRGQLILILGDLENAGIDADFATRQGPGIGFIVLEQRIVPMQTIPWCRQLRGNGCHHTAYISRQAPLFTQWRGGFGFRKGLCPHLIQLQLRDRPHVLGTPGGRRGSGACHQQPQAGSGKQPAVRLTRQDWPPSAHFPR